MFGLSSRDSLIPIKDLINPFIHLKIQYLSRLFMGSLNLGFWICVFIFRLFFLKIYSPMERFFLILIEGWSYLFLFFALIFYQLRVCGLFCHLIFWEQREFSWDLWCLRFIKILSRYIIIYHWSSYKQDYFIKLC